MTYLEEIQKHIEGNNLSFIIGAGFSKNISDVFPLWKDLIDKLAKDELYPDNPEYCERMIHEKGYLGIASEYVRRKGYHEVIDNYIEKNMPYLKKADNEFGYVVALNGKVIDNNPSLECHRKLIGLNVKHIYTFNYDNTIDVLGDTDNSQKYDRQIEKKQQERLEWQNNLNSLDISRIKQDSLLKEVRSSILIKDASLDNDDCSEQTEGKSTDIKENNQQAQDNQETIRQKISELDFEIRMLKNKKRDCYQLVTKDYQISLTENGNNIYKLHGNLRTSEDDEFGFDNDRHIQYVITEEDYKEYPQKHEAFVNLMRISLLKGCFCLLGFSGDDPNFTAWMSWVKDVLDRAYISKYSISENRIYYINADDSPLSDEKLLLLRNNYIVPVNLSEFFPDAHTRKERVMLFLDAIKQDKTRLDEYEEAWREIEIHYAKEIKLSQLTAGSVEKAYKLTAYNRIPNQLGIGQAHRSDIFFHKTIENILKDNELEVCAKLYYSAIKGELMPISAVLTKSEIRKFLQQELRDDLKKVYRLLVLRSMVLSNEQVEDKSSDDAYYETVLSSLFSLDFSRTKQLLENWRPSDGFNKMRKYALSVMTGRRADEHEVFSILNEENFASLQDYCFAQDVLLGINWEFRHKESDIKSERESFRKKHQEIASVSKILDKLFMKAGSSKSSLQEYGNIRKSITFSSSNIPLVYSTKILQVFLELGLGTEINNMVFFAKDKWLKVCENIFEHYPHPSLLMTLLYGNSKEVVGKIAQDFIYSDVLHPQLPSMLNKMLQALGDDGTPYNIKEAIYIAAPIFMKAVAPKDWIEQFKAIYKKFDYSTDCLRESRVNKLRYFIKTGVLMSMDTGFKQDVILEALSTEPVSHFCNEIIINATKDNLPSTEPIRLRLAGLCDSGVSLPKLYIMYNLREWIDRRQLIAIILSLDFNSREYDNTPLLESTCWLAKEYDDDKLKVHLKKAVLSSRHLWATGISDNRLSVSSESDFLEICPIVKELEFSSTEILQIYHKMTRAYEDIAYVMRKWEKSPTMPVFNNWREILSCMRRFMEQNRAILAKQKGYSSVKRDISRLLSRENGGAAISGMLIDDSNAGNAISELAEEVFCKGASDYRHEYILLTNKIISKDSQYLNSCFKHFGWVIDKYRNQFDREVFKPILKSILDTYKPYFAKYNSRRWDLRYAEKDVVEHELTVIYKVYSAWGGKINFWDKYTPKYYI